MTTQDIKTRSSIVKAVTAAVLLAACTSNVLASNIQAEITDLGKNAVADIRADFKLTADEARATLVKVTDSESSAIHKSNFAKLAESAVSSIEKDFTQSASFNAKLDMYAAIDQSPHAQEDRMVVYASLDNVNRVETDTLLPSIANFTKTLGLEFDSLIDELVTDRIQIAFQHNNFFSRSSLISFE